MTGQPTDPLQEQIAIAIAELMDCDTEPDSVGRLALNALTAARRGLAEAKQRVAALSVPSVREHDDTLVEIGGQVMTRAQFDAAQYPLLHPVADPVAIEDSFSQAWPVREHPEGAQQ